MGSLTPGLRRRAIALAAAIYASCATSLLARAYGADTAMGVAPWAFFGVLFLFALFGGLGRILLLWTPTVPWQHRMGGLILGVFGAWLVALYYWGEMQPTKLMAIAGALAAIGGEAIEQLLRAAITRKWPPTDEVHRDG